MHRQTLTFHQLDEVQNRLHRLLDDGYDRAGSWSLGQLCNHLATIMELSQRLGATRAGAFAERIRVPVLMMRFGQLADRLRISLPTLPFARPKPPVDNGDALGVERLNNAIETQKCRLGAKSCTRFQLWHCGHHLSFLVPRSNSEEAPQESEATIYHTSGSRMVEHAI